MNDQADTLDQTDEDILVAMDSDEVLEAAAGTESALFAAAMSFTNWRTCSDVYGQRCNGG